MERLRQIKVPGRSIELLERELVESPCRDQIAEFRQILIEFSSLFSKRRLWHLSSTEKGGGVAEMLPSLVGYPVGSEVQANWLCISGSEEFFAITKRLHHSLHGSNEDDLPLNEDHRVLFEAISEHNAREISRFISADDIVVVHDPQPAGIIPKLKELGAKVVWRCHIGADVQNKETDKGWEFIRPYVSAADAHIFSRGVYVPAFLEDKTYHIIPPSIDPLSPKNQTMNDDCQQAILIHAGLLTGKTAGKQRPSFRRSTGEQQFLTRCADIIQLGPAPSVATPLIVQVSRWDKLKDPLGVLRSFALLASENLSSPPHLILCGPNVRAVVDDPEGTVVFDEVIDAWRALPHEVRKRVLLANLPMADVEENAAIVNALQRQAAIIVQKSIHEGFGLTVTEAMWKKRAIVANAVGGIQDQLIHGESGLLLENPKDHQGFARELAMLLRNPDMARTIGENAHMVVCRNYLITMHLKKYLELFQCL